MPAKSLGAYDASTEHSVSAFKFSRSFAPSDNSTQSQDIVPAHQDEKDLLAKLPVDVGLLKLKPLIPGKGCVTLLKTTAKEQETQEAEYSWGGCRFDFEIEIPGLAAAAYSEIVVKGRLINRQARVLCGPKKLDVEQNAATVDTSLGCVSSSFVWELYGPILSVGPREPPRHQPLAVAIEQSPELNDTQPEIELILEGTPKPIVRNWIFGKTAARWCYPRECRSVTP